MPDGSVAATPGSIRDLPDNMADRLIVALDVQSVDEAKAVAAELDGVVCFFKIGLWLQFAPGVDSLIDGLIGAGKKVFLDAKMFDIPVTVGQAVAVAAKRKVSFITVHGDDAIMRAAMAAKGDSDLKVFAVTVLTSLDDAALASMGYGVNARALVQMRADAAVRSGCDGIIASADDDPDAIRQVVRSEKLLIATPGVRQQDAATHDHKRIATPCQAIQSGADYLVVGRPIIEAEDRVAKARSFIADMEEGARLRRPGGR